MSDSSDNESIHSGDEEVDTEEVKVLPKSFKELGVCEELCLACDALGWTTPTDIQCASIPWALQGKDIIALAETGSGKTAAFAIPVIQSLLDDLQRLYAVVLAPTRELCVQIADQFKALGSAISLEVAVVVGGVDMVSQAMALAKKPHIVVASPGRLVDHLENTKGFSLRTTKYLIMDEADRLLSMDFEESLMKIVQVLPSDKRALLFSATMTAKVSKLQKAALKNPVKVEVTSKYATAKGLTQNMMVVPHLKKLSYTAAILTLYRDYSAMVFTNTCKGAQKLATVLRYLGFQSACLHGKMTQAERIGALNAFKSTRKKILVATEVGSRGLDIPSVDLVLNVDVPLSSKDYIHRVGRTARAGRTGRAITLVTQYDVESYQKVEYALKKKLDLFTDVTDDMAMLQMERVIEAERAALQELKKGDDDGGDDDEQANGRKKRKFSSHSSGGQSQRKRLRAAGLAK